MISACHSLRTSAGDQVLSYNQPGTTNKHGAIQLLIQTQAITAAAQLRSVAGAQHAAVGVGLAHTGGLEHGAAEALTPVLGAEEARAVAEGRAAVQAHGVGAELEAAAQGARGGRVVEAAAVRVGARDHGGRRGGPPRGVPVQTEAVGGATRLGAVAAARHVALGGGHGRAGGRARVAAEALGGVLEAEELEGRAARGAPRDGHLRVDRGAAGQRARAHGVGEAALERVAGRQGFLAKGRAAGGQVGGGAEAVGEGGVAGHGDDVEARDRAVGGVERERDGVQGVETAGGGTAGHGQGGGGEGGHDAAVARGLGGEGQRDIGGREGVADL
ncbi:hypothetical protein LOZ03_005976, partial [Ophidiomyces ophidiicola]